MYILFKGKYQTSYYTLNYTYVLYRNVHVTHKVVTMSGITLVTLV